MTMIRASIIYKAKQLGAAVTFGFMLGCVLAATSYAIGGDIRSSLLSGLVFWAATWFFTGVRLVFREAKWVKIFSILWIFLYVVNILINLYLGYRYGIDIRSPIVAESIVNASQAEIWEYAIEIAPLISVPVVVFIIFSLVFVLQRTNQKIGNLFENYSKSISSTKYLAVTLVIVSIIPLLNPTVRRATPPFNWIAAATQFREQAEEQTRLAAERITANQNTALWSPAFTGEAPKTVALVIGESSNRMNWSLYGYSRKTTPQLDALRNDLVVFQDVVSSFGNTITEMTRMLTIATRDSGAEWRQEPTVTAL
ncbi:MAG TPA: sulfatase-like hydrolase/transferase, partial [Mycoplana sp.]|nr:sulfatase-like hydrolase/transferase [Mycoplana sp.]